MFPLIVIMVFFVIAVDIAIVFFFLKKKLGGEKPNTQWQQLAQQLNLALLGGDPLIPRIPLLHFLTKPVRLEGSYRGCPMAIYHRVVSSGKSSTTYATLKVSVANPRKLSFQFYREGFFSRIGKALGMQDIQTRDIEFDQLIIAKGNKPDFLASALLPEIRRKFLTAWQAHQAKGAIRLAANELVYEEVGTLNNAKTRERFVVMADLLCDLSGITQFYNRPAERNILTAEDTEAQRGREKN